MTDAVQNTETAHLFRLLASENIEAYDECIRAAMSVFNKIHKDCDIHDLQKREFKLEVKTEGIDWDKPKHDVFEQIFGSNYFTRLVVRECMSTIAEHPRRRTRLL